MNFTNSPFERMMKEKPRPQAPASGEEEGPFMNLQSGNNLYLRNEAQSSIMSYVERLDLTEPSAEI